MTIKNSEPQERLELIQKLCKLPSDEFDLLLFMLKPPEGIIAPSNAAQAERAYALLYWVESPSGSGIENLEEVLKSILTEPRILKKSRSRSEIALLRQVKREVASRLESSLHAAKFINSLKEEDPDQVFRPWDVDVKAGSIARKELPKDTTILKIFEQAKNDGKLLIIGKPGIGKTTALLEFAQSVIKRCNFLENYPIPVLLDISSWRDQEKSIEQWLASELKEKYRVNRNLFSKLLENQKLIFILDGLDEASIRSQKSFIDSINKSLDENDTLSYLIVSGRLEEYEALNKKIHMSGAVLLKELTDEQIIDYLNSANKGSLWDSLERDELTLSLVRTPLFLSILAVTIENNDITDLINFDTIESKTDYLFKSFIQKMLERASKLRYRSREKRYRYTSEEAKLWLTWLAQKLEVNSQTEFLIEKMQPSILPSKKLLKSYQLTSKLLFGFLIALVIPPTLFQLYQTFTFQIYQAFPDFPSNGKFVISIITRFLLPIGVVLHLSTIIETNSIETIDVFFWKINFRKIFNLAVESFRRSLKIQLFLAIIFIPLSFINVFNKIKPIAWPTSLEVLIFLFFVLALQLLGFIFLLVIEFVKSLDREFYAEETQEKSFPNQGIWNTLWSALLFTSISGMIGGIIGFFAVGSFKGIWLGTFPIAFNLLGRQYSTSVLGQDSDKVISNDSFLLNCVNHLSLRITLFRKNYIPWNYAHFLNFCTKILLVQRVGGRYRFIHKFLQEYFADMLWLSEIETIEHSQIPEEGSIHSLSYRFKSEHTNFLIDRGKESILIGAYDDALLDFSHVLWIDNQSIEALTLRGRTCRLESSYESALSDLNHALQLDSDYVLALVERGITYHSIEMYEEAISDFSRVIEITPLNHWVFAFRGKTYRLMHHYHASLIDFNHFLDLNPDSVWAFIERGLTYYSMELFEAARLDFSEAIQLDPEYNRRKAFALRGKAYQSLNRYSEALADFNYAFELDPNYIWTHLERGLTACSKGDYEEALLNFNQIIELDHQNHYAYALRGKTYRLLDNHEDALENLNHAIQLNSTYVWALVERGIIHCSMGGYEKSLMDLNEAVRLEPQHSWVFALRGKVHRLMNYNQEALSDFNRATKLSSVYFQDFIESEILWAFLQREINIIEKQKPYSSRETYEFEVVTLDKKGKEISRIRKETQYFSQSLGEGITLEMVDIPCGIFSMGTSELASRKPSFLDHIKNDYPQHQVTVQPFCMGKYPVTQAQWRAVAALPKVALDLDVDPSELKGNNCPVTNVGWDEIIEFCHRLSRKAGLEYRLPSEAEWEYACRARTTTRFHFGQTITSKYANCSKYPLFNYTDFINLIRSVSSKKHHFILEVGSFQIANEFGLFDMHGNVEEWCLDDWHYKYQGAPADSGAWIEGDESSFGVSRGGCAYVFPMWCQSSARFRQSRAKNSKSIFTGFRVVCTTKNVRFDWLS